MAELKTGYIYKIFNSVSSDIYIGSTFNQVRKRFGQHKRDYKKWKEGKRNFTTSYKLFQDDIYNVKWGIIEEVKVKDKKELYSKERFYIENNSCINKNIPTRTDKEWYKDNKEKRKQYKKEYNKNNKEKIAKQTKEYRIKNKDKILEQRKLKIECQYCKKTITKRNIKTHQKTKKCLTFQLTK